MKDFQPNDFIQVENFVCQNTKFAYIQSTLHDQFILGPKGMYSIKTEFGGKCKIQKWENGVLRVNYFMAVGPEKYKTIGKKYHVAYDYENLSANGEHQLIESNVTS